MVDPCNGYVHIVRVICILDLWLLFQTTHTKTRANTKTIINTKQDPNKNPSFSTLCICVRGADLLFLVFFVWILAQQCCLQHITRRYVCIRLLSFSCPTHSFVKDAHWSKDVSMDEMSCFCYSCLCQQHTLAEGLSFSDHSFHDQGSWAVCPIESTGNLSANLEIFAF